jgi:hypothetical protein
MSDSSFKGRATLGDSTFRERVNIVIPHSMVACGHWACRVVGDCASVVQAERRIHRSTIPAQCSGEPTA